MNKLSCVFVAGLAFGAFGCKKKGGGGDCATAINHSMELAKADMAKTPGMDDKMMEKMKDIGLQHCKDDKWSNDVLTCMVDAKTEADSQACYGKLSHDQQEKMNKAAMEAAQPAGSAAAEGSAAPAGSDTAAGSAGSAAPAGSDTAAGSAGSAAAPK